MLSFVRKRLRRSAKGRGKILGPLFLEWLYPQAGDTRAHDGIEVYEHMLLAKAPNEHELDCLERTGVFGLIWQPSIEGQYACVSVCQPGH